MMMNSRIFSVLVLLLAAVSCCYARKDRSRPHHHRGVLPAYSPGPFEDVKLSQKEESKLASGHSVMKQTMPDKDDPNSGGAICVQDIDAPKDAVWRQILDFDRYKGKVPKVNQCKNYVVKKNPDGTKTIKTKMVVGVLPGYSYESYYDHTFHSSQNSLTWKLDYDKLSDFDDVAGHWHVEEHPTEPKKTRVFYACDIKMAGSVPKPILNYISKAALKQATGWVKRESEKSPGASVPDAVDAEPVTADAEPPSKKPRFAFGRN